MAQKKFFRATSLVGFKFIATSLFVIVVIGALLLLVYAWNISDIIATHVQAQENTYIKNANSNITDYFTRSFEELQFDNASDSLGDGRNAKLFDIGVRQRVGNKMVLLNISDDTTKLAALTSFAIHITPATPQFSLDTTNKLIYVTYEPNNLSMSVGAIDLTGSNIAKIINAGSFTDFLTTNTGAILTSNSTIDPNFITKLNLSYAESQQLSIGNVHREILTYAPISAIHVEIGILSPTFTSEIASDAKLFAFYLALLGLTLLLAEIVIYSTIIDLPLTRMITFFDDYYAGKIREIKVYHEDSFGILSQHINELIKQVKSDYKRIGKADEIQEDFLLLSGHVLRTPLTSVDGYIDLLKQQNKDPNLKQTIEDLSVSLNKLMRLEENILSIAEENTKIINAPRETLDVKTIMEEAFHNYDQTAKSKNVNYVIDTSDTNGVMIKANKENLVLAVRNVLDNAIKFTSEGGTVKLYANVRGNTIVISVSDTGIGLTKEEAEVLFKKFSKISDTMEYNADGLGLGLYVVKIITEAYDGEVTIDSIKGNGTIVNMSFPFA
jgi:signal transduction histidine kinase